MVDHFLGKPMDFGGFGMFLYEIITWRSQPGRATSIPRWDRAE
jgi:hypothetical protein